jgi:multicomponent Na+:H+ antiporter subunit G
MSAILEIIGLIIMFAGMAFMSIGILGIFKFKCFYARILVVSKIDTVGAVIFLSGLAVKHGFSFFSGKLLLIVITILILSPLVGHMIARSAYLSGHKLSDPYKGDSNYEGDDL